MDHDEIIQKNRVEAEATQRRVNDAEASGRFIEVYEWKKGESRPGERHRVSDSGITAMEYPHGAVPQAGDILVLQVHPFVQTDEDRKNDWRGTEFVVLERRFLLERIWIEDKESPPERKYYKSSPSGGVSPAMKVWLMVRRLSEMENKDEPGGGRLT